jgi:hypothetical protein
MTKQDRQKLSILLVLLGVLALTIVLAYRMNQPDITSAVQPPEPKTSANPPAPSDARIRLDLVETPEGAQKDVGKRNLFQYRQTAPPPAMPQRGGLPLSAATVPTPIPQTTVTRPPGPPPPPPIPLKYHGFATTTAPNPSFTAFLSDDSRHYNVTAGEILMGRYRIVSITDISVQIEDMQNNRRQTLPLLK